MSGRVAETMGAGADAQAYAGRVARLICDEAVSLDAEPLGEMRRKLGPKGAEAAAARALDAVTELLARMDRQGVMSDPEALVADAAALRGLSAELGLRTLARAASHLADAAARRDPAATGATLARALRVGYHSLEAIWDRCAQS